MKKLQKLNRSNLLQTKPDLDLQHQQNYYKFALNMYQMTMQMTDS